MVCEIKTCSADLPVLDFELTMPETVKIMDSIAPALSVKTTMKKASKSPKRTFGKTFVYLEEMIG